MSTIHVTPKGRFCVKHNEQDCRDCDMQTGAIPKISDGTRFAKPVGGFQRPIDPAELPFHEKIKKITSERGESYGDPKDDFRRAAALKAVVQDCKDPLARHALEMICVKIARLCQTPNHPDSWIDIAGYAWTGSEVTKNEG